MPTVHLQMSLKEHPLDFTARKSLQLKAALYPLRRNHSRNSKNVLISGKIENTPSNKVAHIKRIAIAWMGLCCISSRGNDKGTGRCNAARFYTFTQSTFINDYMRFSNLYHMFLSTINKFADLVCVESLPRFCNDIWYWWHDDRNTEWVRNTVIIEDDQQVKLFCQNGKRTLLVCSFPCFIQIWIDSNIWILCIAV